MRILVNAIHAKAGGGLTYLRHLLPRLAGEADFDIAVIPHPSQAGAFAALSPSLRIHAIAMPRSWLGLLVWEQLVLPIRARRIGYDLLFSAANFGPLAVGAQVIVLQNALSVARLERRLSMRLYWATLRLMTLASMGRARAAIAVSHYAAATAGAREPRRRTAIIHHGVDAAFTPSEATPGPGAPLLAVADLYVQKNLGRLIEATAILRRARPVIRLDIAGEAVDADHAAALRNLVAKLGLEQTVRFLGRCPADRLVELYRSCAVFVFPSLEESFGMPLVEAMACGAPVVASQSGATPEIVGEAALLCDATDPQALAAAIGRVLDDGELRRSLRRRAIARAQDFSWDDCARCTASVLRQAAG
jgi:glycosyltransferase involved in cell wall biosynthesis